MAGVVMALGLLSWLGWLVDWPLLRSLVPGWVEMKANTALALMLSGWALLWQTKEPLTRTVRRSVRVLASLVLVIGVLTLVEYFLAWNLGLDELFFSDRSALNETSHPGRMAPTTAFCFTFIGLGLAIAIESRLEKIRLPLARACGLAVLVIGGFALTGYVADGWTGDQRWSYTGMAVHTTLAFMLLGSGLLGWCAGCGGWNWSLDRLTTAGFFLGLLLLLLSVNTVYHLTGRLQQTATYLAHRQEVLKEIQEIAADLNRLESNQQSYLILGDERRRDERASMRTAVTENLHEIQHLTADNPEQQRHLDQLIRGIGQVLASEERVMETRRSAGWLAAQAQFVKESGLGLSQAVDQTLEDMQRTEYRLLVSDQREVRHTTTLTFLFLPIGVFLSLTMLLISFSFLNASEVERQEAEQALRESEQQLRLITDNLPTLVSRMDRDLRYVFVNAAYERWLGWKPHQMLGHTVPEVIGAEAYQRAAPYFQQALAGAQVRFENRIKTAAGSDAFVEVTLIPDRDAMGNLRGLFTVAMDITERKQAEIAAARLAAIVAFSDDAIVGKDVQGLVTSWNAAAQKMFGYSADEMMGHSITAIIPRDRHSEEELILQRIRQGESVQHFETVRQRKNGSLLDVSVTVSPIKNAEGQVVGASKVARDITERKRVDQEIRDLNLHLERRVVERTTELEAMIAELDSFGYSVSHDLRAPLRAISGFAHVLVEGYAQTLDEAAQNYFKRIVAATQRMGELIDDLLKLSRVSRQDFHREPVNLTLLAREIADELHRGAPGRKVEWLIADALETSGDPRLLRIGLGNLLNNAWKFTAQQSLARIEVGMTTSPEGPIFFVRDSGVGFDMRYADKLFSPFQRLHSMEEFPGTGIGLATVQRIIKRHGGRVWVEAKLGEGAMFSFSIPTLHSYEKQNNPAGGR
jgi:PAS domain S-box-containing protein